MEGKRRKKERKKKEGTKDRKKKTARRRWKVMLSVRKTRNREGKEKKDQLGKKE